MTLSLNDMAHRVGLNNTEEAERYVLQMVRSFEVYTRYPPVDFRSVPLMAVTKHGRLKW